MNRAEFQKIAELRLADCDALIQATRYGAAYYLAGYVVECALKACIAKNIPAHEFPRRDAAKLYTHDLAALCTQANLDQVRKEEETQNPPFETYWTAVKDWREDSRYEEQTKDKALAILEAIAE